jgi:hypothetical protein
MKPNASIERPKVRLESILRRLGDKVEISILLAHLFGAFFNVARRERLEGPLKLKMNSMSFEGTQSNEELATSIVIAIALRHPD